MLPLSATAEVPNRQVPSAVLPGVSADPHIAAFGMTFHLYHRFKIPGGNGYNRETCLSPLRFDAVGRILPVDVFGPVKSVKP